MADNSQQSDLNSNAWIMAESEHFVLRGKYEEAVLYRKSDNARVTTVGDFYGDPEAGIIDEAERYCVIVGCGVIVYKLREPFEGYMYDTNTSQWYEFGRDSANIDWFEDVRQISPDTVELIDVAGNHRIHRVQI